MAQKRKQYVKLADGTLEQQMLATSADIVEITTIEGLSSENVQDALEEIKQLADTGGVTSVNGQKGDVTITKSSVGLGNVDNTSDMSKPVSTAQQTAINTAKSGAISDANSYTDTQLANYIKTSAKGVAGGVASLGTDGKVPSSQLPSYVDDVLSYSTKAQFPSTGETGKIYVDTYTNKTYRWSGSAYVEISASLALGETDSTAYAGDKGKENASKISHLQDILNEVLDDERNVGTANNALKLGGLDADQYAKLTDIPENELVIVTGSWSSSTLTLETNAYATIQNAIDNNKIVVLDIAAIGRCYYDSYSAGSYYFRNTNTSYGYSIKVTASTATVTNIENLTNITKTGTGPIVSLSKSGNTIYATHKAMTVADLPTPAYDKDNDSTFSLVAVNSKGQVTGGQQLIEWGTSGQTTPSASLAVGGLFFQLVN